MDPILKKHNGGFWLVALIVLVAWVPGMAVTVSAVSRPHQLGIAPALGSYPLTVRLSGTIHVHDRHCWADVRIHFGDGETVEYRVTGIEHTRFVEATKTYSCPGLYRVIRERDTHCAGGSVFNFVDSTTVISVTGAPKLSLGWEHYAVSLQPREWQGRVTSPIDPWADYLVRATVDFDDGVGVQPLTWFWDIVGGKWVTHWRIYVLDGVHTATVVNTYNRDGCEFDVISTVDFTTSGSPLVPVEETTWGRVKSLYRE